MDAIRGIKETCLYLHDLELAREFYGTKLGFEEISFVPDRHVFFRVGTSVLLCFNPDDSRLKKSPPAHFAEGDQHMAFEVDPEDYSSARENIRAKEIEIIDNVTWKNGQESFYFRDPEGNVLEIVPHGVWE